MARKYASGKFTPKHAEKYVGKKSPTYRSSWEFHFMKFCDENPAIQAWASEAVKIPYRNPLTGRHTIYVPDFFIQYKTDVLQLQENKLNKWSLGFTLVVKPAKLLLVY